MTAESENSVKNPNVAGQFYQSDANRLDAHIAEMLAAAEIQPWEKPIDVLMVPETGVKLNCLESEHNSGYFCQKVLLENY